MSFKPDVITIKVYSTWLKTEDVSFGYSTKALEQQQPNPVYRLFLCGLLANNGLYIFKWLKKGEYLVVWKLHEIQLSVFKNKVLFELAKPSCFYTSIDYLE